LRKYIGVRNWGPLRVPYDAAAPNLTPGQLAINILTPKLTQSLLLTTTLCNSKEAIQEARNKYINNNPNRPSCIAHTLCANRALPLPPKSRTHLHQPHQPNQAVSSARAASVSLFSFRTSLAILLARPVAIFYGLHLTLGVRARPAGGMSRTAWLFALPIPKILAPSGLTATILYFRDKCFTGN